MPNEIEARLSLEVVAREPEKGVIGIGEDGANRPAGSAEEEITVRTRPKDLCSTEEFVGDPADHAYVVGGQPVRTVATRMAECIAEGLPSTSNRIPYNAAYWTYAHHAS